MSNGTNDDLRIGISILDEDLARVELLDKRLGSLTTTTTGLGTASKAGLGQMAEAMKEAKLSVRSVADAYKASHEMLDTEIRTGEEQILKLVSSQNKALAQMYNKRLADEIKLSGEELQVWKDHQVRLGGLQALQLKQYQDHLKKEKALKEDQIRDLIRFQKENASDESTRYQANLKRMAEAQSEADMRYVALRKDSLARGKTLILQEAKDGLAQVESDRLAVAAAEESRYNSWLKKAAEAQSEADMRYVAMRKDSLARGKTLILQAAKDGLAQVEADRLAALSQRSANIGTTGQRLGGAEILGAYTPYNALRTAPIQHLPVPTVSPRDLGNLEHTNAVFQNLAISGNNLHSVVRGLASGFGALWLTWGNTAPLLAGAAISFSLSKALQYGKEFESLMYSIQEIAGASTTEVEGLRKSLFEMGVSGMYGPIEVAKGLNTLMLAGLNANEAIQAIGPTLRFASAGDIDMQKAAEVTVAVGQAYSFTAKQYETLQDIISKTAADTMSSVTNMSGAFKTASVVAQQFHLALTDTAEGLGGLAQIGIVGVVAGTAYRNFYTEITKQGGKVEAAMRALNVQIRETAESGGELKPTLEIFRQLSLALVNKTKAAQDAFFADLSNERGAKLFAANQAKALETIKRMSPELLVQADNMERMGNKSEAAALRVKAVNIAFDEMAKKSRESIEGAAGFNFMANLEKQFIPEGQIKGLKAALETDLIKAFEGVSDSVYILGTALHEVFVSDTFKNGLSNLVRGVVDLISSMSNATKYAWEHKEAVLGLAAAYVLLGGTSATGAAAAGIGLVTGATKTFFTEMGVGVTLIGAMRSGIVAMALSAELAAPAITGMLATGAVAAAGVGLAGLAALAIAATVAITAMAIKWLFMGESAEAAANKAREAQITSITDSSKALKSKMTMFDQSIQDELKAAELTLKARRDGASEEEVRNKVYAQTAINRVEEYYNQLKAIEYLIAKKTELYYIDSGMHTPENAAMFAQLELQDRLANLEKEKVHAVAQTVVQTNRLFQLKKQIQSYDLVASKSSRQAITGSDADSTIKAAKATSAKKALTDLNLQMDNEVKQIEKRYTTELGIVTKAEKDKQDILAARRDAELIDEGTYFGLMYNMTKKAEEDKLALIESTRLKNTVEVASDIVSMRLAFEDWKNANPQATAEQVQDKVEKLDLAIQNLKNTQVTFNEKLDADRLASMGSAAKLVAAEIIRTDKQVRAMSKSFDDFWTAQADSQSKAQAASNLAEMLKYLSPEQAAYTGAFATEVARLNDEAARLAPELQKANQELNGFMSTQGPLELLTGDLADQFDSLQSKVALLTDQIAKLKSGAGAEGAGLRGLIDFRRSESDRFINSLADAVEAGLYNGAQAGKAKLRDILVSELKKQIRMDLVVNLRTLLSGPSGGASGGGASGSSLLSGLPSMFNSFATSSVGGALGLSTPLTYTTGSGVSGGLTALGTELSSAASSLSAAAPYIAAAVAALSLISGLDTSGTLHTGGAGGYSKVGGSITGAGSRATSDLQFFLEAYSQETSDASAQISKSIVDILDNTATAFGKNAGYYAATAFADDTSKDGAWGALMIKLGNKTIADWGKGADKWPGREFGNGAEGKAAYAQALAVDIRTALDDIGLPQWATKMLNDLGSGPTLEQLGQTVGAINEIEAALANLGERLINSKSLTEASISSIMDLLGGPGSMNDLATSYYKNFYTAAEIAADDTRLLGVAFSKLGVEMPKTREQFRTMMESAMAAGDPELIAGLLKLQGSFADLIPAADDAGTAVSKLSKSFSAMTAVSSLVSKYGSTSTSKATLDSLNASYIYLTNIADRADVLGQIAELEANISAEANQAKIDAMNAQLDIAKQMLDAAKGIKKYLDSLKLGSLSTLSPEQMLQEAAAQYQSGLVKAQSGDPASASALQGLADTYLQQAQSYYGSNTSYAGIFDTVTGQLENFATNTIKAYDPMVTNLERQIKLLQKQTGISQATQDRIDALYIEAQAQYTLDMATAAKEAIGLDNITTALNGLPPALAAALSSSIAQQFSTVLAKAAGTSSTNPLVQALAASVASGGTSVASATSSAGAIAAATAAMWIPLGIGGMKLNPLTGEIRAFAAGGAYPGGMALVGEQGPELINFNRPGQVYTAGQTAAMLGSDKETADLLKALLAELRSLRSQQGNESNTQVTRLTGIERKLASIESTGVLEKAR